MLTLSLQIDPIKFPSGPELRKVTDSALRIWGAYFRRRVQGRFEAEGPGWAPRKASDDLHQALRETKAKTLAEHRLKRKLERDLRRAQQRLDRGKGKQSAVDRRYAVLKEFERQIRGGTTAPEAFEDKGDRRLAKSVAGLKERKARAAAAVSGRVLGAIANSIKSTLKRSELTVGSSIPWAGVQNEGGAVGNRATLPARPFLFLENEDIEMLTEIVENRLAAVFEAA